MLIFWNIVLYVLIITLYVASASYVTVEVDPYTQGTTKLRCNFNLQPNDILYEVKWLKNNKEFYRYSVHELPHRKVLSTTGLKVNLELSDANQVVLSDVDSNLLGKYICQVSVFTTYQGSKDVSFNGAGNLRNVTITAEPSVVKTGETAKLRCNYDLGSETLYSVKWYKNDEEFYRYVPRRQPTSFSVGGLQVNMLLSDQYQVLLDNMNTNHSGTYKCEVSTEAPSFFVASAARNISVEDAAVLGNLTVSVTPSIVMADEAAILRCNYDLKGGSLYAVKWYKDDKEFYRYVPKEHPPIAVIPVDQLQVISEVSDKHQVVLDKIKHSGKYTCEVTTDAPYFITRSATASMSVKESLINKNIQVNINPAVSKKGGSVKLECNYDLEGDPLYSLRWYWKNREFYRYSPNDFPKVKLFRLLGMNIDISQSTDNGTVVLTNVDTTSSGEYSCEVAADAPTFATYMVTKALIVMD